MAARVTFKGLQADYGAGSDRALGLAGAHGLGQMGCWFMRTAYDDWRSL